MHPGSSTARKALLSLCIGMLLAASARAEWISILERYPSGSIRSEERADEALKNIESERRAVDTRFAESERACYAKFFATDCLQKAKDQRREALTRLRSVEIEANTFKRRARAEAHEKAAAERSEKREAQANERLQSSTSPASGDSGTE